MFLRTLIGARLLGIEEESGRVCDNRLGEFGGAYFCDVPVVRAARDEGYAMLPEPLPLSFVCVAPYSQPVLLRRHTTGVGYRHRLKPPEERGTRSVACDLRRDVRILPPAPHLPLRCLH